MTDPIFEPTDEPFGSPEVARLRTIITDNMIQTWLDMPDGTVIDLGTKPIEKGNP